MMNNYFANKIYLQKIKKVSIVFFMIFLIFISMAFSDENKNISKLSCTNCKEKYLYEEDIEFAVKYYGDEPLYVTFGIEIMTDNNWKLLTDDTREISKRNKIASLKFNKGEIKSIKWNKYTMLPPEMLEKYNAPPLNSNDPIISYDIKIGGRLRLFAWKVSPLPYGIHQAIHEFNLLPKKGESGIRE